LSECTGNPPAPRRFIETFLRLTSPVSLEAGLSEKTTMGVIVQIGTQERALEEANESWIQEQFGRRQRDGVSICVIVNIQVSGANLRLTTPMCAGGSGGGRQPNAHEQQIIGLWNDRKLNSNDFNASDVVAFIKRLDRLI
jgi:hypothetical protein